MSVQTPSSQTTKWKNVARQAAVRHGLDPKLFVRQINAESGFRPDAGSPAGARGIAQIMPATAAGWGVDPMDPAAALDAAAKAMSKYVRNYGGWKNALVAYNAGPGRVGKPLYSETRAYINRIMQGADPETDTGGTEWSTTSTSSDASNPFTDGQAAALRTVFGDSSPRMKSLIERAIVSRQGLASDSTPSRGSRGAGDSTPVGGGDGPGTDWKSLLNWTKSYAGADVQGDFQTTGGNHDPNGYHPKGRAIDLGDATVSMKQYRRIAAYARRHPGQFKQLYFNKLGWGIQDGKIIKGLKVAGHDDHMHLAV